MLIRLKECRIEAGLTQRELAEKVNLSENFLWKIEMGLRKPSLNTINKLVNALNTTVDKLIA